MSEERYEVWVDEKCYAKEMRLDTALILVKGLFNEWYAEDDISIKIRRMTNCNAEVFQ